MSAHQPSKPCLLTPMALCSRKPRSSNPSMSRAPAGPSSTPICGGATRFLQFAGPYNSQTKMDIASNSPASALAVRCNSSVFLDRSGGVIRPALLWNDARTTPQRHHITDALGLPGLHSTVGNLPLEGFTAPKLLWLKQNEPDNYARLRALLLPKDYIRYRLSGDYATEPSDAAGTLLFDIRHRRWSQPMLQALEVDAGILPRVVESTEISGVVTPSAASELGIQSGIPIIGGGADNAAGAVGCGATDSSVMQVSIGTSGAVVLPSNEPHVAEDMNLHTFCHCAPNLWYLMGVIISAGNAFTMAARHYCS